MEQLIELSPFILGGIGLTSLLIATLARIVSKEKRKSKVHKIFTFIGFFSLFAAAGITAWTIITSLSK
jgi:uncharacterized membrane protein